MARTMLNPANQITASTVYAANGAAGATLQSGAIVIEDDLNAIRSQVSRLLDATLSGNWYDDVATTADGKKRSIKQLNTGLDTLETKTILARADNATGVPVPAGQNYVILTAASSQAPANNIAIALTTLGAVSAQSMLNATAFAANELTALAGSTSATPKNLVAIRDATTLQVIESGGYDVFGLLQAESTAADGAAFNDTSGGNRGKLSFVTINPATGTLQPASANDIGGHTVNYSYVLRGNLGNIPEQYFLGSGVFTDSIADTNVNLARATANTSGSPVPVNTDVLWRVANGVNFKVQNQSGSTDLFGITPNTSGNAAYFNTSTLAINTTSAVTSTKGISLATGGQAINLGVATGVIGTTGPLTLQSLGGSALAASSAGAITFADGNLASAGWTSTSLALSASTSDWTAYKTAFGEASILNGIVQAAQKASHTIKFAAVTALIIPAGTNVTGTGTSANIDSQLLNYSGTASYQTQQKIYINGNLMRPGSSSTDTSQDYYPGISSTNGDFRFTFPLRAKDVLTQEIFQNPADNF
jgi:hypothetical protein